MKIAIVSDSHDNLVNIDKVLAFCKKEEIKIILHCGDLCSPSIVKYLAENFAGQIWWIEGNVHGELKKMSDISEYFANTHYLGEEGSPAIPGINLKIYLTHYPEVAEAVAKTGNYDYVFYGHTHQPWEETINSALVVNPGTLAGMFNKATFAVLDTAAKKLELKILEIL